MLTVITGGMFAEKSTELLRRGKRLQRAGKSVLYVKPKLDTRYSDTEIVTHDGNKVEAITIDENKPFLLLMRKYSKYDVILIDEVQFFHPEIVPVTDYLANEGKSVIVAGLDMDYQGTPFKSVAYLMAMAEEVLKLKAVCASCGADAWVSHKEDNNQRIQLGTDEYKPLCRKCYSNQ